MNGSSTVTYDLEAGMEWRFELEQGEAIAVRVSAIFVKNMLQEERIGGRVVHYPSDPCVSRVRQPFTLIRQTAHPRPSA